MCTCAKLRISFVCCVVFIESNAQQKFITDESHSECEKAPKPVALKKDERNKQMIQMENLFETILSCFCCFSLI